MKTGLFAKFAGALALVATPFSAAHAEEIENQFDSYFGTEVRAPREYAPIQSAPTYGSALEQQIAQLADGSRGRIGVYAIDLSTGREIGVLADERFPLASTSKVAIAAAYLAGVDQGRWTLSTPLRLPRPGGASMSAHEHLRLMISKSCNDCTDALLQAVGGPAEVNRWMRDAGINGFQLDRNIRTLVNEDGRIDPATTTDYRDSATPRAMGQLLAGIYQGRWLSASSRAVLIDAMQGTTTGKQRMPSALPMSAQLAHKTGTLSRTASDIGIFHTPDGRAIAAAIYVTGQSASMAVENGNRSVKLAARRDRDARISNITGALYEGFMRTGSNGRVYADATYNASTSR